jgi:hypothetical protein
VSFPPDWKLIEQLSSSSSKLGRQAEIVYLPGRQTVAATDGIDAIILLLRCHIPSKNNKKKKKKKK